MTAGRRRRLLVDRPDGLTLKWWREIVMILAFYGVYTAVRNSFGSDAVSPEVAFRNAEHIIHLQAALGLFIEEDIQRWFLDWEWFIRFWNIYYGFFHFAVTAFVMIYLYVRVPRAYPRWRTIGLITTGSALVGFALFPLMPPRLLPDCGPFGGCDPSFDFVDTMATIGGLWSFESGAMQEISNQYAAMPSLHFGWSLWCALALVPHLRRRWARWLLIAYPWLTLFAIVVTANHFWLDAVGGALVLGIGLVLGTLLDRRLNPELHGTGAEDSADAVADRDGERPEDEASIGDVAENGRREGTV